jgi:hypothetical protein
MHFGVRPDPQGHVRLAVHRLARGGSNQASMRSTTVAMPWPTPMHIVARP